MLSPGRVDGGNNDDADDDISVTSSRQSVVSVRAMVKKAQLAALQQQRLFSEREQNWKLPV